MATHIKRGESLFIPFENGESLLDSQLKPRIYKSVQNFDKAFPKHIFERKNIEVVEYKEVKRGYWIDLDITEWQCSKCHYRVERWNNTPHCPNGGADMRGGAE